MKKLLLLGLLVLPLVLTSACTTVANRRDLYSPKNTDGKYTQRLHNMNMGR